MLRIPHSYFESIMQLLKFYFDTHIPKAVATQLRQRGVDVVRCEEVGLATAHDLQHLEYATANGRALVTHDEDFLSLDSAWRADGKEHGGIFYFLPHLQGNVGRIFAELMTYYELVENGGGTVEEDIASHVFYVS
ncbi:MAG: DUF5615 family PIN-like protein [Chloroflexota bacterium]|nr:DUF5615 family PIN-like protein [Chloroflexota bacterium]